jgi:hypothetical protein
MAVIQRDMFPPHIMQRIQTPIQGRAVVGNLSVSRERPWGGILYPEPQQSPTPQRKKWSRRVS